MHQPCVYLVKEDLVADEKDAREHVLDHWVATHAFLMKRVEELTTAQTVLLDVCIELCEGR